VPIIRPGFRHDFGRRASKIIKPKLGGPTTSYSTRKNRPSFIHPSAKQKIALKSHNYSDKCENNLVFHQSIIFDSFNTAKTNASLWFY
jgi:hypothetical protein